MPDFVPIHQRESLVAVQGEAEGDGGTDDASDDGVGGGNGQPLVGGEEQPQRSGDQRTHHDVNELQRLDVDDGEIDDTGADRIGHFPPGNERTADFKDSSDDKCLGNGECAGTDGGAKGVGDVIAANVKGHEQPEGAGQQEEEGVIEAGVTQPPIDEISHRGEGHGNQKLAQAEAAALGGILGGCRFLHIRVRK